MKLQTLFFSLLLSLTLNWQALAEIKTFGNISVDVPTGWVSQEHAPGVILTSPDASTAVTITKGSSQGKTLAAFAQDGAKEINGAQPQKIGDKIYAFEASTSGTHVFMMVKDIDGKNFVVVMVTGNFLHRDLDGIVSSLK